MTFFDEHISAILQEQETCFERGVTPFTTVILVVTSANVAVIRKALK